VPFRGEKHISEIDTGSIGDGLNYLSLFFLLLIQRIIEHPYSNGEPPQHLRRKNREIFSSQLGFSCRTPGTFRILERIL
jgi:hypothetical protein